MADREKLIELVHDGEQQCSKILCRNCEHFAKLAKCKANMIADHLISHGVTVRERGRWEKTEYSGFVRCSCCKDVYIDEEWLTAGKWNGCPNCFADLRGEEDG